jgi:hypothetical protein
MPQLPPLNLYLAWTIPLAIILIFLLYRNLFSSINSRIITAPIPSISHATCNTATATSSSSHMANEYYIPASYMTPALEPSAFSYMSADMIHKVVDAGARCIQIPFCAMTNGAPVCALADPDTGMITSMNYLAASEVFNTVAAIARTVAATIFIELVITPLNCNLDEIAAAISAAGITSAPDIGQLFAQMCNVRIVLFTFTDISRSPKLQKFVIQLHRSKLVRKMTVDDFASANYNGTAHAKLLSSSIQSNQHTMFHTKYMPQLEDIMIATRKNDMPTTGIAEIIDEMMTDPDIGNKMIAYNRVGITMVTPNDITAANYNYDDAMATGCQIIYMNWSARDTTLKSYITMFADAGGSILKSPGLRIESSPDTTRDITAIYPVSDRRPIPVITSFAQYLYQTTRISWYPNQELVATAFNGTTCILRPYQTDNPAQIFVIMPTKLADKTCYSFVPANALRSAITVNGADLIISSIKQTAKQAGGQAFYPIEPVMSAFTEPASGTVFSMQKYGKIKECVYNNRNILGIANANTGDDTALAKMVFHIDMVPSERGISFTSADGSSLAISSSGIIGLVADGSGAMFIMSPASTTPDTPLLKGLNIPVRLVERNTRKYMIANSGGFPAVDSGDNSHVFILEHDVDMVATVRIKHVQSGKYLAQQDSYSAVFKTYKKSPPTQSSFKYIMTYLVV